MQTKQDSSHVDIGTLAGGYIGLIWAVVVACWVLLGVGYLAIVGGGWYSQAARVISAPPWYDWPWGWPGPQVAERIFTGLGLQAWEAPVMRSLVGLPRFALAAVVNAMIATAPILGLVLVFRCLRFALRPSASKAYED